MSDQAQTKAVYVPGDWITWCGGTQTDLPPLAIVEVQYRDGGKGEGSAHSFRWSWLEKSGDIVAYRVMQTREVAAEEETPAAPNKPGKWQHWSGANIDNRALGTLGAHLVETLHRDGTRRLDQVKNFNWKWSNTLADGYDDIVSYRLRPDIVNHVPAEEDLPILKDGWISWRGDKASPAAYIGDLDALVNVTLRNGKIKQGPAIGFTWLWEPKSSYGEDIISYCPVQPGPKPTEPVQTAKPEAVNHPKHYNSHPAKIECIDVVEHMGFNLGNAIKYIWRADEKGKDLEDLEKSVWYIQREIEKRKKAQAK